MLTRINIGSALSRASFSLVRLFVPGIDAIGRMSEEIISEGTFDGDFERRRHAIKVFNRHNEEVKKHVPSERLLVRGKRRLSALCEFLGVEDPDKPFPHLNN